MTLTYRSPPDDAGGPRPRLGAERLSAAPSRRTFRPSPRRARSRWASSPGSAMASGMSPPRRAFQGEGPRRGRDRQLHHRCRLNAALASGQLQAGNIATHTAMAFAAAGLPIKIVALLDVSMTGRRDHHRRLGRPPSRTSRASRSPSRRARRATSCSTTRSSKNGMTIADIEKVPMPAADAGTALIAGKVPVAVTYEPYLTLAKARTRR